MFLKCMCSPKLQSSFLVIVYESGFADFSQKRGRSVQTAEPWLLHEARVVSDSTGARAARYSHYDIIIRATLSHRERLMFVQNMRGNILFVKLYVCYKAMFFLTFRSFLSCHFVVYSRLYKVWFEPLSSHISSFYIPLPALFLRLSSFSCLLSHRSFFIQDWALGFRSKKDFSI